VPGRHAPASSKSFLISLGTAVGGALVALAVVVGIAVVVLNAGSDAEEPGAINTPPTTAPTTPPPATTAPTPTASPTPSPTETAEVTPVSETTLRILNGTRRAGLAASMADRAKAEGYPAPKVGNSAPAAKSTIYYRADSQDEAEELRRRFPDLTEIAPAPSSFQTDVMLTVVLGDDYPSPAPSPTA